MSLATKLADEKAIRWTFSVEDGATFLELRSLADVGIGAIVSHNIPDEIQYKYELLGYDGEKMAVNDIEIDPVNDYVYAIDDQYLYIYDKKETYPNLKDIGQTGESDFVIRVYGNQQNVARGDSAHIVVTRASLGAPVLSYEFEIVKPDGSIEKFERVNSPEPGSLSFTPKGFEYNFDSNGLYVIRLITYHADNIVRTAQRPIHVEGRLPVAKYDLRHILPSTKGGYLFMNSDQKLSILRSGKIYELNMIKDYAVIDYPGREVYLMNKYDGVWLDL